MLADLHPPEHSLSDFLLGKLADGEGAALEAHLESCAACRDRATALRPADPLVGLLVTAYARAQSAPTMASWLTGTTDTAVGVPVGPPAVLADHPKYRPIRLLGRGGMGSVWLTEHAVMQKEVAVKVVRPELSGNPEVVTRFLEEVRAAGKVQHPNLVAAHDAEVVNGVCLLAMEYVPGETLAEVVRRGPLPVPEACRAVRDAARGLAAAHAAGLVHRDVKPSNLIRGTDGVTKVLDFGLVSVERGGADGPPTAGRTAIGMLVGTPDYIAPEQIANPAAADARADVYELGCTLYHLLAGHPPYPARPPSAVLAAHGDPAVRLALLPNVPRPLADVVERMTAKIPAGRYQTAADVVAALEPYCGERSTRRSGWRWAAVLGLLAAVVGLAAGMGYMVRRDTGRNETVQTSTDLTPPDPPALVRTFEGHHGPVRSVAYSPDGKHLLSGSGWPAEDRTVRLWDVATGELVWAHHTSAGVLAVAFLGDDRVLFGGGGGLQVQAMDRGTRRPVRTYSTAGALGDIHSIAASGDSKVVIAGGGVGRAVLWDADTGREIGTLAATASVVGVELTRDRAYAVTASSDGSVIVWDAATRVELKRYSGTSGRIGHAVGFTPDGRHVVLSDDATVVVWEWAAGGVRKFPRVGIRNGLNCLAISPDGKWVISAGADSTVRLWDFESGTLVRADVGHTTNIVWGVAFSPDSRLAVSAGGWRFNGSTNQYETGTDYLLRLWRVPGPKHTPPVREP